LRSILELAWCYQSGLGFGQTSEALFPRFLIKQEE
jgi:hypothetical protein